VSITCKSIPSGAQYVTLQKYFSHPSLVIYFFATPHLRLKQRLEIGERLPNQLDQSETGSSSQIIFIYTLLRQVHSFDVHFTSLSKLCKYAGPKPFCWAKPAWLDFSSCNFNVQGHILSTAGDALTTTITELKFKEQQQQQRTWVRIKPDTGEKQVGRREQPAADPGYSYPLQLFLFSACLPACPLLPLLLCTRLDTCNSYKQILRTSECAHFGDQSPQPQDNPNIQWLLLSQPLPLIQQTTEWCKMEMIEYGPEQVSCRLGFVDLSSLTTTGSYQISRYGTGPWWPILPGKQSKGTPGGREPAESATKRLFRSENSSFLKWSPWTAELPRCLLDAKDQANSLSCRFFWKTR